MTGAPVLIGGGPPTICEGGVRVCPVPPDERRASQSVSQPATIRRQRSLEGVVEGRCMLMCLGPRGLRLVCGRERGSEEEGRRGEGL